MRAIFFCKNFTLSIALINVFINFVIEINQIMRKTRYSDVISKAEVLVNDQNNYTRRGALKSKIQRRIDRMTNRAVFLTQFEIPEPVNY